MLEFKRHDGRKSVDSDACIPAIDAVVLCTSSTGRQRRIRLRFVLTTSESMCLMPWWFADRLRIAHEHRQEVDYELPGGILVKGYLCKITISFMTRRAITYPCFVITHGPENLELKMPANPPMHSKAFVDNGRVKTIVGSMKSEADWEAAVYAEDADLLFWNPTIAFGVSSATFLNQYRIWSDNHSYWSTMIETRGVKQERKSVLMRLWKLIFRGKSK